MLRHPLIHLNPRPDSAFAAATGDDRLYAGPLPAAGCVVPA
ncbi:hypothetical protein [Microbispora sp. NPDC046933]